MIHTGASPIHFLGRWLTRLLWAASPTHLEMGAKAHTSWYHCIFCWVVGIRIWSFVIRYSFSTSPACLSKSLCWFLTYWKNQITCLAIIFCIIYALLFFFLFFYSHLLSSLTFSHGDTFGSGVKKSVDFCFMSDGYLFAFLFTNFKKHSKMILFSGQVEDVVNKVKAFSMTACMQDVSCRLLSLILAGTYILNPGCIH
jgi:hypothetical protein